jgi:hypothetical protein
MPRIVMGDSREQTIRKFQNEKRTTKKFLLIDLDAPKVKRTEVLYELKLQDAEVNTFFMIQETEAWFLSQPQLLGAMLFYRLHNFILSREQTTFLTTFGI